MQSLKNTVVFICMGPYGLSLPIRPFQGPLYTAIGPFSPSPPPLGGSRVVCVGSDGQMKLCTCTAAGGLTR